MNAYELADELQKCIDDGSTDLVCVQEAADMLRQQADRIVALEKQCEALADEYAIQVNEVCKLSYENEKLEKQTKPLSNEEIEEVIRKHWNREYKNRSMLEFAKAILRKAQEK